MPGKAFSSRVLLVAWFSAAAGCVAVSGLDKFHFDGTGGGGASSSTSSGNGGGGGDGAHCGVPADCPTASPCHRTTCIAERCSEAPIDDGMPCQHGGGRVCHDGQCVECITVSDCPDPGNDCEVNACRADACTTSNKKDGSSCGNGLACMGGVCSGCTSPADCGTDTFCKTFVCNKNATCGSMNQADGTVTNMQTPGDCQVNECINGVSQSEPDDTDTPPDDGNACTIPCMNGVPNAPATSGTMCSTGLCDGAGNCVQCLTDSQCTAPETCGGGGTPNTCGCMNCQLGSGCTTDATCLSGFCVDSVCCNSICTSICMACNVTGLGGTCSDIPVNTQEPGICDDSHGMCGEGGPDKCACNGAGKCREKSGQFCDVPSDCASGNCNEALGTCQ